MTRVTLNGLGRTRRNFVPATCEAHSCRFADLAERLL